MNQLVHFDLEALRTADIRTVDPVTLVDIRDIKVNKALPQIERVVDFVRQAKNPYLYKCGKMVVMSSFADTEATIEDRLECYALSL